MPVLNSNQCKTVESFFSHSNNLFLLIAAVLSGGALLFPGLQRRGLKATVLQTTQWINQGKIVLVDVREPTAFSAGHLLNAKNIPLASLKTRVNELEKYKTRHVVAICASGVQSAKAASLLKGAGFSEAYSLEGGVEGWRAQGLPLVK